MATINNGIDQHLQNAIFNHLCIRQYNDGIQNVINNLKYSGNFDKYHNDKKTFMYIESGIENTQFIYHSMCVGFMLEHTYSLLQLMSKSVFEKYKKYLHLILVNENSYYYHIETANIYAIMYTLITEKILINCVCNDCMEVNDTSNDDLPATATVAAGNNESEI
jgi:hypothetical protein